MSDRLSRLSDFSDGLGLSGRSIFASGEVTIRGASTDYGRFRQSIVQATDGLTTLRDALQDRQTLVVLWERKLLRWLSTLREADSFLANVKSVKAEMLADSITYERGQEERLSKEGSLGLWTLVTGIGRLFGFVIVSGQEDEIDQWWKPFLSKPLNIEDKEKIRSDTQEMLECWKALGNIEVELPLLENKINKLLEKFTTARERTQRIEKPVIAFENAMDLFDRSLGQVQEKRHAHNL
jgi:hypothetical protein